MKKLMVCLLLVVSSVSFSQVKREYYGVPGEPVNGIMFGGGFTDQDSFDKVKKATGKTPSSFFEYCNITNSFYSFSHSSMMSTLRNQPDGVTPVVAFQAIGSTSPETGRGTVTCGELANSNKWDNNLAMFLKGLRDLKRLFHVIPLYEVDHRVNGYKSKDAAAVIRKTKRFADSLGVKNIVLFWGSAGVGSGVADANRMGYYPGDDYVDAWSWNMYDVLVDIKNKGLNKYSLASFCDSAARRGKPVMIHEAVPIGQYAVQVDKSGKLVDNASKAVTQWLQPYFDYIFSIPNVKWSNIGMANFTKDRKTSSFKGNGDVNASPITQAYFKQMSSNPIFLFAGEVETPACNEVVEKIPYTYLKDTIKVSQRIVLDTLKYQVPAVGYRDTVICKPF